MITIPKLTEKDLIIFKDKKVVIYGYELSPTTIYKILKKYNITVIGCCYEHAPKWRGLKERVKGVPYVSSDEIDSLICSNENVIIQGVDFDEQFINLTQKKASAWGVEYSELSAGLLTSSFVADVILKQYQNIWFVLFNHVKNSFNVVRNLMPHKSTIEKRFALFTRKKPLNPIVICSPMKTADHTLNFTFDGINELESSKRIEYINLHHVPTCIDKKVCEKKFKSFKIIMGVRSPIDQNLSLLFQMLSSGNYLTHVHSDIFNVHFVNKKEIVKNLQSSPVFHTNNIQVTWDYYIEKTVYPPASSKKDYKAISGIQAFMNEFSKCVLDITKYPFDKERGYTLIKDGNTEVFVYQLEKLNHLVSELSDFVGVPFDALVRANDTNDKWIAESYKQAKKEIEITQEYFDRCFDEPYVKHCYSEADIEKFQARWRPHIKKTTQ